MAKKQRIPALVYHRPTGQARVRINGKDHYLGKWDDPGVQDRYDELIAQLLDDRSKKDAPVPTAKTLSNLLALWWTECKHRFGGRGKGPCGYAGNWRVIMRLMREAYGDVLVRDLSARDIRVLIETEGKKKKWSRTYMRDHLTKVKIMTKWWLTEELIQSDFLVKLQAQQIRDGKETVVLGQVDDELVRSTLPHLSPKIAAMVKIQRLTAMRPGELIIMKAADVDRSGKVWMYRPTYHKMMWRKKERCIPIPKAAQQVLLPWLLKAGDGFVFPSGRGQRPYTSDSYRRAIQRACERHGLPNWSPYQIRKTCAQQIRDAMDVEHSAAFLGHSSSQTTQNHYATSTMKRAIEAADMLDTCSDWLVTDAG